MANFRSLLGNVELAMVGFGSRKIQEYSYLQPLLPRDRKNSDGTSSELIERFHRPVLTCGPPAVLNDACYMVENEFESPYSFIPREV